MPKIDAPTVAEHHSQRRAALIQAGGDLLADQGLDAVTLAAVGAATGLARSSVYQYFDSAPALIAAVVEEAFPRATEQLANAVARAATPQAKIDCFVRAALDLAANPAHRSLYALAAADQPPHCRARVRELHASQYAPLLDAVTVLGVPDPGLTTQLVVGVVQAAAQAIAAGQTRSRVQRRTLAVIHSGIGEPGESVR
jgi:AcrR family transcriptional regulator